MTVKIYSEFILWGERRLVDVHNVGYRERVETRAQKEEAGQEVMQGLEVVAIEHAYQGLWDARDEAHVEEVVIILGREAVSILEALVLGSDVNLVDGHEVEGVYKDEDTVENGQGYDTTDHGDY